MKKSLLFIFIFSVFNLPSFSQSYYYKRFEGTINKNLPIVLHLTKNAKNELSGNYYYVKNGAPIHIGGTFDPQKSSFKIEEYDSKQNSTGSMEGTVKNGQVEGFWKTADGKKSFTLSLKESYNMATKFDAYYLEKEYLLFEDEPEFAKAAASSHFLYPTQTHDPKQLGGLQKLLRLQLNETGNKPISQILQEQMDTYGKEYVNMNMGDQTKKEVMESEIPYAFNWTVDSHCSIFYNDNHILSLEMFTSDYTGGVHGNYSSSYLVADTRTAKQITLNDIFKTNFKAELDAILVKVAKKDYADAVDGTPEVTENFYVDGAGLHFVYNPYEIASYAVGQVILNVPFSQIKNLLKPNNPINHLIK